MALCAQTRVNVSFARTTLRSIRRSSLALARVHLVAVALAFYNLGLFHRAAPLRTHSLRVARCASRIGCARASIAGALADSFLVARALGTHALWTRWFQANRQTDKQTSGSINQPGQLALLKRWINVRALMDNNGFITNSCSRSPSDSGAQTRQKDRRNNKQFMVSL